MGDLGGVFDANAKENNRTGCVPAGEYDVIMIKSERKPTKDGSGSYLNCEFKITRGEYQNRSIFHRFNLFLSPNKQKAIDMATNQFSQFCKAVGVLKPQDSSELRNKNCLVKVNVEESDFGTQNNITKFSPRQVQSAIVQAPEPASAASGAEVW